MIKFTKRVIKGSGWKKTLYDVTRNGVEIGTLFENDGGFSYESDSGNMDFASLSEAKDTLSRTEKTFIEELAEKGLV